MDAVVAWMLALPVFAERIPRRKHGRKLRVDVGHRVERGDASGHASPSEFKIRVAAGPCLDDAKTQLQASVLEVILHELCHIAAPARAHHNETFRRILQRAAREAWAIDVPIDLDRGDNDNRAYAMGHRITNELKKLIESGTVELFKARSKQAPSRTELAATLVRKRAEHATKMLARAERRLKLAKTLHKRWAEKLCYYERRAAKAS